MKIKNLKLFTKDFNKYGGVEDTITPFDTVWLQDSFDGHSLLVERKLDMLVISSIDCLQRYNTLTCWLSRFNYIQP